MVHVMTARPSLGAALGQGLGQGVGSFLENQYESKRKEAEQLRDRNKLQQALQEVEGIYGNQDLTPQQKEVGIYRALSSRPDIAKALSEQNLQREKFASEQGIANRKTTQGLEEDQKRYNVIKQNFGDKAAEIYRAAPEGGKTQILSTLLEGAQRGVNFEDLLNQQMQAGQMQGMTGAEQPSGMMQPPEKPEKPSFKAIDYDRGLTPKERVARQEGRYGKNLPLYQESQKKLQGLEAEKDSLDTLSELSPKIGTFQRLNINPSTGELIIPGLASAETQRFVKTINDFTVKAKDSFGARVSNFELDRFMKRLPTLANSEEGRRQIIRQMQIINDINTARERSLQQVFDEHGGIRNIDYDKAERLADKESKGRIENLRKESRMIEGGLEKQYQDKIKERKKDLVPSGRVAVEKDGKMFSIPSNKLKQAVGKGYKQI